MWTSRGPLLVVLACSILLGACSGDAGPETAEGAVDPLDCVELRFPCSWQDTTTQARERTGELLTRAGRDLDAGRTPEEVAADLADAPGVVTALADPTGVQLRVEGAPPVVAWSPLTLPLASAIDLAANWDDRRDDYPGLAEVLGAGAMDVRGADVHGAGTHGADLVSAQTVAVVHPFEPTHDPDVRPRSALLLRPWEAMDAEMIHSQLLAAGRLPQGATPESINVDNFGLGRTPFVLDESPHIDLTRGTSDAAFSEFGAHDLVVVQTHSASFGPDKGCDPAEGHVCGQVLGGYPLAEYDPDEESAFQAIAFQDTGRLPPGATVGYMLGYWTVGYTPDFFRQTYPGGSLDAVVILNSCGTAGSPDIGQNVLVGLATTATASGGPAVYGWTDFMNFLAGDLTTAVLADLLVNQGVSTRMAMEAIAEVPELQEHVVAGEPTDHEPRMVMAGRDVRVRDVVTVLDDGEEMQPGAVLQAEGTPEDGTDDRIEQLVLRVDGVPDDGRDAAELTWQLPGRHDQPIAVDTPLTSREGLQVREIALLAPMFGEVPVTWRSYELTFTDLDLQFDLTRDELRRPFEHDLVVELRTTGGEPSRHTVDPVHLRQGVVEVLDPELGQPLEADERVMVEGRANDGQPESFPLIVSLDHLDEGIVDDLVLEVRIGGVTVSVPGSQWERVEEGRYRVEREVELFDFDEDEEEVAITASVELPETGPIDFAADPVVLVLEAGGCGALSGQAVSVSLQRTFSGPVDLGEENSFLAGVCRYEAERSTVELSLVTNAQRVTEFRQFVAAGHPTVVDRFGDAATYDLTSGNALNPSSIEVDGSPQYNNFVNLVVAVDDRTLATIHVRGNIVIEEGPETGLLDRLRALVDAIRENT